jgi:hypothetical protein
VCSAQARIFKHAICAIRTLDIGEAFYIRTMAVRVQLKKSFSGRELKGLDAKTN